MKVTIGYKEFGYYDIIALLRWLKGKARIQDIRTAMIIAWNEADLVDADLDKLKTIKKLYTMSLDSRPALQIESLYVSC